MLLIIVVAVRLGPAPQGSPPIQGATPAPGQPIAPDISNLSPRESANRLFDRVMRAAEANDTASVQFFVPMALAAYRLVGPLDNDARYDMGMIYAVAGNAAAALAQADSIEATVPQHLLGIVLRHTVREMAGDSVAMLRSYRRFLENYERELATDRPGYRAHGGTIEAFHAEAQRAVGSAAND